MLAQGRALDFAVSRAMRSRLGIGGARLHVGGEEGEAETKLGVFSGRHSDRLGGNDDISTARYRELDDRIRGAAAAGRLGLPELWTTYRRAPPGRPSPGQFFRTGRWRCQVTRRNSRDGEPAPLLPPSPSVAISGPHRRPGVLGIFDLFRAAPAGPRSAPAVFSGRRPCPGPVVAGGDPPAGAGLAARRRRHHAPDGAPAPPPVAQARRTLERRSAIHREGRRVTAAGRVGSRRSSPWSSPPSPGTPGCSARPRHSSPPDRPSTSSAAASRTDSSRRPASPSSPSAAARACARPAAGVLPGPGFARPLLDAGRWLLLPEHRARVEARWRAGAAAKVAAYLEQGPPGRCPAHDYNTLGLAAAVADRAGAALVYDAHELWAGRARVGRPEPLRRRRAAAREDVLLARADLVLTVSEGIAERLRARGARRVVVVRNSFPARPGRTGLPQRPTGLVYAGRIGPGRDLEVLAAAGAELAVLGVRPVVVGPADATTSPASRHTPGTSTSGPPRSPSTRSTRPTAPPGSPS